MCTSCDFTEPKCQHHLEDGAREEKSEQLDEVKQNVAIFLFHSHDVGQGERTLCVNPTIRRGSPWKETKLEEVLHYNSKLKDRITQINRVE